MRVVSNTSPLIFLTKIEQLSLLEKCFSEVWVPDAVRTEFGERLPPFIKTHVISQKGMAFVKGSIGRLHQGELEAMVAAQELNAHFVLMDDLIARRRALRIGVKPLGTIGVLLLAHRIKALSSFQTEVAIHILVEKHGLFISEVMLKAILTEIKS